MFQLQIQLDFAIPTKNLQNSTTTISQEYNKWLVNKL